MGTGNKGMTDTCWVPLRFPGNLLGTTSCAVSRLKFHLGVSLSLSLSLCLCLCLSLFLFRFQRKPRLLVYLLKILVRVAQLILRRQRQLVFMVRPMTGCLENKATGLTLIRPFRHNPANVAQPYIRSSTVTVASSSVIKLFVSSDPPFPCPASSLIPFCLPLFS